MTIGNFLDTYISFRESTSKALSELFTPEGYWPLIFVISE